MKKTTALFLLVTMILVQTACTRDLADSADAAYALQAATDAGQGSNISVDAGETSDTSVDADQTPEPISSPVSLEYDDDDLDSSAISSGASTIRLEGDSITVEGDGATVDGSSVNITSAGTYSISGTLNDGQIRVDTADEETVVLVLNGADIACSTSAPIYVSTAEKTVITLADGTENSVTDGDSYVFEDGEDEPNAAVFSKDDLTINGNGSLAVNANYNHGIASKDDLRITGGSITVDAVNDGIKGRDSIGVKDGAIIIKAGGDGMQSNNDEDVEKGVISIDGGTFDITAGMDGIQAQTRLTVTAGDIVIVSGGGSSNSSSGDNWGSWGSQDNGADSGSGDSAKGLKAGVDVTITGGTISIDSSDDSIHSNDSLTISGGDILLASGDDGIHSDSALEISGGNLTITKSYEGIESAVLTFRDGTIHIAASDDGINAAGGVDGSAMGGRPGQNAFNASMDYHTTIDGGYIFIDANGDGIDSNGPIDMTGGTVLINGPTSNNNGALDYWGTFNLTGGFLVAVGSSGMAQAPSTSSTQYSVMQTFQAPQAAGTMIHIETEDGEGILTFVPTKAYQSVLLSSPELKSGSAYTVYSGGRSTGVANDGVYSGGTYTAGTEKASFTISSIVTGAGSAWGGFRGAPDDNRRRPPGRRG
jgi:hypothetical protein